VLDDINRQIDDLQKKINGFSAEGVAKQLNGLSMAGDAVVRSIIPQIDQINKLETALKTLQDASNTPGVSRKLGQDQAAINAGEVQLRLLKDQTEESARHNAKVLEIAASYQGVSTQTAMVLDNQQQQLAVASAVTGQERLAAQEAANRHDLELQGVEATEAASRAAGQREIAEARLNSQVESQSLALRDQLAVSGALTGSERIRAEAAANMNALLRAGVDAGVARANVALQTANSEALVDANVARQTQSIENQTELLRARDNGNEAAVASAQAYSMAIAAGASSAQAAALASATMASYTEKARQQSEALAKAASEVSARMDDASRAAHNALGGPQEFGNQWGNQVVGLPGTSGTPLQQAMWEANYGKGGYSTYINGGFGLSGGRFDVFATPNEQGMAFAASQQLQAAALKNMDAVTAAKFKAGSFKLPAIDAQNLANAYLAQGSHSTSATSQKAAADFVSQYGDSSSSSASSGLSPLYLSSSGSTNLGFRAAEGMDYTVPGSGPVDSVKVSGMVSPGERMIMIPPGGAAPRDMQGGNTQARPSIQQTINISAPSMQGASDTMSQLAARASRAAYAASRHR
jgi:hypothetical protein